MTLHPDAYNYDARLRVISSHLKAAISASVGIYMDNPATHGFDEVNDLHERLDALLTEVRAVRQKVLT